MTSLRVNDLVSMKQHTADVQLSLRCPVTLSDTCTTLYCSHADALCAYWLHEHITTSEAFVVTGHSLIDHTHAYVMFRVHWLWSLVSVSYRIHVYLWFEYPLLAWPAYNPTATYFVRKFGENSQLIQEYIIRLIGPSWLLGLICVMSFICCTLQTRHLDVVYQYVAFVQVFCFIVIVWTKYTYLCIWHIVLCSYNWWFFCSQLLWLIVFCGFHWVSQFGSECV